MAEIVPEIFELNNGLRVVTQYTPFTEVTHCGILINAGTRDEEEDKKGLAHFIEHVIFKGTQKRKAYHILNRLESVGGELNAFTTKEETCVYASFLTAHFERATELLQDIVFNSVFPAAEIEKEKEVIIDEIKSCQDSPIEQIYDDFEEQIFKGHSLSYPILGTTKTVKALKRDDVLGFVKRNYVPSQMTFAVVGNVKPEKVRAICEKLFRNISTEGDSRKRKDFKKYKAQTIQLHKPYSQAHCIVGNISYSLHNPKRIGMALLNNILGGPGMNSRLNLNIREKYGIAYNIYSSYTNYTDTGVFSIYLGTDFSNVDKSLGLIKKELSALKEKKLGPVQLQQSKQQFIGQIAMGQENRSSCMQAYGKSLLNYNKVETLESIYKKIEKLNAADLMDIANEVFEEKEMSTLLYLPSVP